MTLLGLSAPEWRLLLWTITVGIACTVPCALLGCYLVLRRMSLMGDAISHAVLPGIVLAVFLSGQITSWVVVAGAMVFGVLTAWLTQTIHDLSNLPEDASMGVVFTALFALGVVLIAQVFPTSHLDDCVLYGVFEAVPLSTVSIFGVRVPSALPTMVGTLAVTLLFMTVFWKELKIVSFDPDLATAMGLKTMWIHYLLMAMVAGVTVTAFEVVGSVLVIAMLIVPAATAHLLSDRLPTMMLWSAVVAILSTVFGVLLAGPGLLNTNAAGMMAVVAGALFTLAVFLAPRHGILVRAWRNLKLGLRIIGEDIITALYKSEEAEHRSDPQRAAHFQREAKTVARGIHGWLAEWVLLRMKQVQRSASRLSLTDQGRGRAAGIVRSHRLWESYLGQHFPLPADHLHDPAERMEHYIGPQLQQQLATELKQPDTDPHGRAIPPSRQ
jgi:manganese/zinc/iron transport system permease protein